MSREIGKQSSVGLIYADREFSGQFNHDGGIDTHLRINDHWTADLQGVVTSTRFSDRSYSYGSGYEATVARQGRQHPRRPILVEGDYRRSGVEVA